MPLVLLLLFIVLPIAELYVIIEVGKGIGFFPTLGLLVLSAVLGAVLVRSQGRRAWQRFAAAVRAGRPPANEAVDGALVLLGGALLIAPGFITDILGLLLLIPPTRAVLKQLAFRRVLDRLALAFGAGRAAPRGGNADVDGTAHDVTPRAPGRLEP